MMKKDFCLKDYVLNGIFLMLFGLFKYLPSPVFDLFRRAIAGVFLKKSGKRLRIYEGVTLWYPYNISIGNNVTLNEHVYISGYGKISIGDGVRNGHRTSILSSDHNIDGPGMIYKLGIKALPVVISDNVYIGCNVTILGGVTIGEGCVIGAGSVVTKDLPANSVAAGNPARILRSRQCE